MEEIRIRRQAMSAHEYSGNETRESTFDVLRRSCCDALAIEEADADSDFFVLGGDSLAAVSIASAVAGAFGGEAALEDVVLRALFEESTLGQAAAKIDEHLRGERA